MRGEGRRGELLVIRKSVSVRKFLFGNWSFKSGRHYLDRSTLLRAFALGLVEDFLAQAQVLRRGFDVFVRTDVFQRAFQTELERRIELNAFAVPLRTHVGELFRLARVDRNVVVTSVFADDHASVDFVPRLDHEASAL